jgi:hypothetical protein
MDDRSRGWRHPVFALACAALLAATPARADWPADSTHFVTLTPGGRGTMLQDACADGRGGAFVCWGFGAPFVTFCIQHLDALGRPRIASSSVTVDPADGAPIHLAGDGAGGAVVLLQRWAADGSAELWLRRLDPDGATRWTTPLWAGPFPNFFDWLRIVPDPASGGWLVAWLDASATPERVRVQRVNAEGEPLWGVGGAVAAELPSHLAQGPLAPDGEGGAWVACWDYASTTAVHVQHVRADGVAEWGTAGTELPVSLFGEVRQLAGDATGGVWVSLMEWSAADGSDRVQRLRPDGSPAFGPGGLALPGPPPQRRGEAALGVTSPERTFVAWVWYEPYAGWATQLQVLDTSGTWVGAQRALVQGGYGEYLGVRVYPLADGGAMVACGPTPLSTVPMQRVAADGTPLLPPATTLMNVPDAMVGSESMREVFLPPFPTGDGGFVHFRTLVDSAAAYDEHAYFVRAQHVDAWGRHGDDVLLAVDESPAAGAPLAAPVPSPMRDATRVRYTLAEPAAVSLALFDLTGRRVRTLASGPQSAGGHFVALAREDGGEGRLAPGLYWIRLVVAGRSYARRLVVLD